MVGQSMQVKVAKTIRFHTYVISRNAMVRCAGAIEERWENQSGRNSGSQSRRRGNTCGACPGRLTIGLISAEPFRRYRQSFHAFGMKTQLRGSNGSAVESQSKEKDVKNACESTIDMKEYDIHTVWQWVVETPVGSEQVIIKGTSNNCFSRNKVVDFTMLLSLFSDFRRDCARNPPLFGVFPGFHAPTDAPLP